ncbi:MAG TPA: hypothetical protein VGL65_12370 [Gemmatimonadales bacterium]
MRFRAILGAACILLGGIILARGLSYHEKKDVLDIGQVRVATSTKKSVAPWIGGVVALVGLGLVLTSGKRS